MSAVYSLTEVEKHSVKGDLWMVIHGKVYDVTTFAEDHPGGEEAIYDEAGKDASETFEDIGHSDEARELLQKYYIGDLDASSAPVKKAPVPVTQIPEPKSSSSLRVIIPAIIVIGAILYKFVIAPQGKN